jgi:DNA replication protein DnaC
MNALNKVVENLIQVNMTRSPSDKHICPYCQKEVPKKEIELFGKKRFVQPVCECEAEKAMEPIKRAEERLKENELKKLFSIHDLGERFNESNFTNFIVRSGAEKCFKLATKYVEEFDEWEGESLMFWGEPGNGKSHLATAVANELTAKGKRVVFISMPDLLEKIKATFNKNSVETEAEIMRGLQMCDLLIIDDIGAEKVSDWVQEVIFRIVDGRYKKVKPIMATSNLEPKELAERIGKRAYDRLIEISQPIQNEATSYRREKAKARMERFKDL